MGTGTEVQLPGGGTLGRKPVHEERLGALNTRSRIARARDDMKGARGNDRKRLWHSLSNARKTRAITQMTVTCGTVDVKGLVARVNVFLEYVRDGHVYARNAHEHELRQGLALGLI